MTIQPFESKFGVVGDDGVAVYFSSKEEAQLFIADQARHMHETLTRLRDVVGGPFYADADEKLAAVERILWPELQPENRPPQPIDDSPCPF